MGLLEKRLLHSARLRKNRMDRDPLLSGSVEMSPNLVVGIFESSRCDVFDAREELLHD
jgi:hypothetical protein